MKSNSQKRFFYIGLAIFYLINFFAPNKAIYFASYFTVAFFFYLSSRNLRLSLLYSLILAFFSEIGIGARLFQLTPEFLDLGAGYFISAMTFLSIVLMIISLKTHLIKMVWPDWCILIFLSWCTVFFIFYPQVNIFYGLLSLVEITISYFLLRINLTKKIIPQITIILISMILFQIFIGISQIITHGSLGIISESSLLDNPFGIFAFEEESLSRITGTFGHPNILASFLVTFFPFYYFFLKLSAGWNWSKNLYLIPLFFTYSRLGWGIFLMIGIYISLIKRKIDIANKAISKSSLIITGIGFIGIVYFFLPFFVSRIQSLPLVFIEGGSMTVRTKLMEEALNIFVNYPMTGVGLNYSIHASLYTPVTDIFKQFTPGRFFKIHNTFLEILAESGLIGLTSIILFLYFVIKSNWNILSKSIFDNYSLFKKATLMSLVILIIFSSFNPFFHSSQFKLFFLLSAFLLI